MSAFNKGLEPCRLMTKPPNRLETQVDKGAHSVKHITNVAKTEVNETLTQLCKDFVGRRLLVLEPIPTELMTIEELHALGIVGVWENKPGMKLDNIAAARIAGNIAFHENGPNRSPVDWPADFRAAFSDGYLRAFQDGRLYLCGGKTHAS